MKTLLIFTVGGSTQPIINAIKELKPDFIFFICSSGTKQNASERLVDGTPIKAGEVIIKDAVALPPYEKILIPTEKVDFLDEVYSILEKELIPKIKKLFSKEPSLRIIANYTGGTKTMSIALCLLAIFQENWEIQVNTGIRTNLIKIDSGDHPIAINKINLLLDFDLTAFKPLMEKFYYEQIVERLKNYLISQALLPEKRNFLSILIDVLEGFIFWDTFNHKNALFYFDRIINSTNNKYLKKALLPYFLTLKHLNCIDSSQGQKNFKNTSYYEKVLDLVRNAERRAVQKRFDDAVARLYRAIELLAQIRLKIQYRIDPSKITEETIKSLPDKAKTFLSELYEKSKDNKGILKIALTKCYELLLSLEDPIGIYYSEVKNKFLDALKKRNFSILAHGENPISEEDFQQVAGFQTEFILNCLKDILGLNIEEVPQFPKSFEELGLSI